VQAARPALPAGAERHLPWLVDGMVAAAAEGARYIRARAADLATLAWTAKAPTDFVSEVDTGAEERIRESLADAAAGFGAGLDIRFLAEESAPDTSPGPGITFVVDPLDGTTNFLHGYPEYAVSIGALLDGVLAAGVVHNVATGELFTAVLGGGAYRNGGRISVSSITDPSRALLGTGFPFKYPEHIEPYLRGLPAILRQTAGVRRAGSAALDLADVACGRVDAFWELRLAPWDLAAGLLLIREAGGVATDLAGRDAPVADGPLVAGNPTMHRWLLDIVGDTGNEH
jgi:myo-inositol-1(or 4)-monophosphatase